MPRKPRFYVAGIPCHVVTRGNDRQVCFIQKKDYEFYLECLRDACVRYKVSLHAYVLMTNHVHLLMTPMTKTGISQVMQSIGRRYVQRFNFKYKRTGTLWEGRHRASLIEEDTYLLACYRYIELNPVRANMVTHPLQYPWSSYAENAGAQVQYMTDRHALYKGLGLSKLDREETYCTLFDELLDPLMLIEIRQAALFSMPVGSKAFKDDVENITGLKMGFSRRGRPPNK